MPTHPAVRGATLVIPMAAEGLLQVVVRPWQVRRVVAGEQAGPVTPAHFHEVIHRTGQRSRLLALTGHAAEQPAQLPPHHRPRTLHLAENVSRPMHPAERDRNRCEQSPRRRQRLAERLLQLVQLRGEPPFFSAVSRLLAIRSSCV